MSDINRRALAAAISREREANRDWSKAAKEYRKRIAELEADRNAWRECAERLGRQVASLTHNIPTDIPLLGGGEK